MVPSLGDKGTHRASTPFTKVKEFFKCCTTRKNFCPCVKNCVILHHGSELLAKGGFRRFPFSKKSVPKQLYSHIFVGQQWVLL